MKYYSIYDLVGIQVYKGYPWMSTLFITEGAAKEGQKKFDSCQRKIQIIYQKKLKMNDVRFIGDGAYIGNNVYVDETYGIRIERTKEGFRLFASQECNEWLVIAVELCLLQAQHTLIHAAALEKEGKVLLLPSWGGVGKTATVCHFVREHGWKLLGDDLIIIGKEGALPFLKPFVIYPYHKSLFPELFTNGQNHTVKNLALSRMMSRAIPFVKRSLRPFPRVLAYLRKHNPQSMRVSPNKIFSKDQISAGGPCTHMVWLERSMEKNVNYHSLSPKELASKACSVSSTELFASELEAVYHMCGCGMISFEEVFQRMHDIILELAQNTPCDILEIPQDVPITKVGKVIFEKLNG